MTKAQEEIEKKDPVYDYILWGLVPVHVFILIYFLQAFSYNELQGYEKTGYILSYGLAAGLAINNAHELGHRVTKHERLMSKFLLLTSLYMHFYIEHNKGHHKYVATEHDPASSRFNENIYRFYFRSIINSWLSAYSIEKKRMSKNNWSTFSLRNEMLRFQLFQLVLVIGIALFFDWRTMFAFIGGAFGGALLLETVNYIEHYGLTRIQKKGVFEQVKPHHSWNSDHPIGRLLLLELSRHSDHHYRASRKYQVLRYFEESPQMPTGYPGMMLLSLCPPLWFKVMNKKVMERVNC